MEMRLRTDCELAKGELGMDTVSFDKSFELRHKSANDFVLLLDLCIVIMLFKMSET